MAKKLDPSEIVTLRERTLSTATKLPYLCQIGAKKAADQIMSIINSKHPYRWRALLKSNKSPLYD
jgi:hypothetical protein